MACRSAWLRLAALSVTLSAAVQVPDAVGLNVTLKVQLARPNQK
jgi:hypothetical protein